MKLSFAKSVKCQIIIGSIDYIFYVLSLYIVKYFPDQNEAKRGSFKYALLMSMYFSTEVRCV